MRDEGIDPDELLVWVCGTLRICSVVIDDFLKLVARGFLRRSDFLPSSIGLMVQPIK